MAKYSKKLVEVIIELVENDMSVTEICKAVSITRKTFYEWRAEKPEFAKALDDARDRAYDDLITFARRVLRERIEGYTVEETTYTYEPSSLDEDELVLKKKVVKSKHKEPSITSLCNMIERTDSKRHTEKAQSIVGNMEKKKEKKGLITPSNSEEALILAKFYQKIEGLKNSSDDKESA